MHTLKLRVQEHSWHTPIQNSWESVPPLGSSPSTDWHNRQINKHTWVRNLFLQHSQCKHSTSQLSLPLSFSRHFLIAIKLWLGKPHHFVLVFPHWYPGLICVFHVFLKLTIKESDTLEHQPMVWWVPYSCTQPHHRGSGIRRWSDKCGRWGKILNSPY